MIGCAFMGRAHANAWVTVSSSLEVSAFAQRVLARGDIDIVDLCTPGHRHAEIATAVLVAGYENALSIELFGSTGASRFDREDLNELWFLDATEAIETEGSRRILVTAPEHPSVAVWWPRGHVLGREQLFVQEVHPSELWWNY